MLDRRRLWSERQRALASVALCERAIERIESRLREARRLAVEAGLRLADYDHPH
jgi:hypothetical protein